MYFCQTESLNLYFIYFFILYTTKKTSPLKIRLYSNDWNLKNHYKQKIKNILNLKISTLTYYWWFLKIIFIFFVLFFKKNALFCSLKLRIFDVATH